MYKDIIEKRGQFEVRQRKEIFENNWMKLVEDKGINLKLNKPMNFAVIYAAYAVAILPVDKDGNIYLNREFKYAINREAILCPGGFIEEGEEPIEAAKRELREETGIIAKKWTPLGEIDYYCSVLDSKYFLFLARDLEFGADDQDEGESIQVFKTSLEDAYQMIINNEIQYAPSIALILKAKEMLTQES